MIMADMQLLAQTAAERVLNSIPEGLVIAGLTWVLLRITGRHNSGTKFVVWFAALLSVAALPLLPHSATARDAAPAGSTVMLPPSWGTAIFAMWGLIASWAMARILVGLWNVRRLRDTSTAIADTEIVAPVRNAIAQMKTKRPVEIRRSERVTVPTAIGFLRPTILLPGWALEELSPEELKIVLFHEFAHLRRRDDWTNLAQKVVRTIFFFHPAVWWIERRLSLEREMACDDLVLAETSNPRAYAECLVSLAERSVVRRGLALAQAVIGRARETAQRLGRILDGRRRTRTHGFKPALAIAGLLVAICSVVMPYRPNLVSFENAAPVPMVTRAALSAPGPSSTIVVPAVQTANPSRPRPARRYALRRSTESIAKVTAPIPGKLQAVNSVVARAKEDSLLGSQFVVVMRTTQVDGRGVTERFCVWRVTVDKSDPRVVHEELIVRSL